MSSLNHFYANSLIVVHPWPEAAEWQAEMVNRLAWAALLTLAIEDAEQAVSRD